MSQPQTSSSWNAGDASKPAGRILRRSRRPVTRYRRLIVLGVVGLIGLACVAALAIGFRPLKVPSKTAEAEVGADAASPAPDFRGLAASYAGADGGLAGADAQKSLQEGLQTSVNEAGPPAKAAPTPASTPAQQQALALAQSARGANPFFGAVDLSNARQPALSSEAADAQTGSDLQAQNQAKTGEAAAGAVQNMQDLKHAFIATASSSVDYVAAAYKAPLSPYEIKAGDIISAALVTAINSDLPGEIVAQVTRNVYDHPTGRHLIIPQGARLLGRYDSQIAYGQSRALIVWNRIIMPDGRSINIGSMTGGDLQGASGLNDRVDAHLGPLSQAIFLSTAITTGGLIAQNAGARSSGNLVLTDAAGGVSAEASQAGQRLVEHDLNRQPTITIRAGWPLTVIVSRDIVLEPY